MNYSARQFVLLALGLGLGLTGGLALLNFIVDPFNRFGHNRLGVYISAERECKAAYVTQYPHDALLVGNSREIRIPPARLEGFHFFNGAFSGGTAEEIYYFLRHFARRDRLVVLAVDLGAQDPAELHGDIFAPAGLSAALDNLLNLQTTEYSIRTLSEAWSKRSEPIGRDGLVPEGSSVRDADRDDPRREAFRIQSLQQGWAGFHCPPPERMSYYAKIGACLRERGIPCVVVIPPVQEAVARAAQSGATMEEVAAWKRRLGAIFSNVLDLSFSDYDAATNFYRSDPVHFKPDVGVRLLNREVLPSAARLLPAPPPGGQ
jgi:hypothetical protein